MKLHVLLILLPLIAVFGCTTTSQVALRPAQLQWNYPNLLSQKVTDRVGTIPQILMEELKFQDKKTDYKAHVLTSEERVLFENTISALPDFLLVPLKTDVLDIYFIDNFSGGGMTYLVWRDGRPKYILIFNPQTLHKSLSNWLTYRDNTTFNDTNSQYSLREYESGNHIGFLHTLIHESCHVYDFVNLITRTSDWKLSSISQKIWLDQKNVLPSLDFPVRSQLSFYNVESKPKVLLSDFVAEFDTFRQDGFASIYGSWNSLDEFAENETYVVLNTTYRAKITLEIRKDGNVFQEYSPTDNPAVIERNLDFMKNR